MTKRVKALRQERNAKLHVAPAALCEEHLGRVRSECLECLLDAEVRARKAAECALREARILQKRLKLAEAEIRGWVDSDCSCGGRGPDDNPCPACRVWHDYKQRTKELKA